MSLLQFLILPHDPSPAAPPSAAPPDTYPSGAIPVPEAIAGTAFFPGGHGLWMEEGAPSFPVGGIMVLGHDFHSGRWSITGPRTRR